MKQTTVKILLLTLLVWISSPAFSLPQKPQKQPRGAAREALLASMTALSNATSFRFTEVQANSGEGMSTKVVNTGSFQAPDKYHSTTDMNLIGKTGSAEMVIVGEEIFLKTPGGQWEKKSATANRIAMELTKIRKIGLLENLLKAKDRDVTPVGKVTLDGESHDLYQFDYTAEADMPLRVRNKIWVKLSDGLPSKIETNINVNQQGLLNFTIKSTTSYSSYNEPVEIKAPI